MDTKLSRGKEKKISILLPSRGRIELLKRSINELILKAKKVGDLEIIIRIDYDDLETINNISLLPWKSVDINVIIGDRFGGYCGTGIFFNELASLSKGDFLFLYGDDALMETKEWDSKIYEHYGKHVALNIGNWVFPIISRSIYQTLGHISLSAHPDTWIESICMSVNIEEKIDIKVLHDRFDETGNNKDKTYEEKMLVRTDSSARHFQLTDQYLLIDINKISQLIK